MTLQSLFWSEHLLQSLLVQAQAPVREHLADCEKIASFFADEESRFAYRQELAYKILNTLLPSAQSCELVQGPSILAYKEKLATIRNHPLYQKFPLTEERQRWVLAEAMVSIFFYDQYRYGDICPKKNDIIFDCGACFGESALWFSQFQPKSIHSFEIDPENKKILENVVVQEKLPCAIVPKALSDTCGELWYHKMDGNAGGGYISQTPGTEKVCVTTIDTYVAESGVIPSMIKMDIEGAEYQALLGARETLQKHKPRLAISLYHQLDDMWRIPLLLQQLMPEYRFFCKKNHPYVEFVLYAD